MTVTMRMARKALMKGNLRRLSVLIIRNCSQRHYSLALLLMSWISINFSRVYKSSRLRNKLSWQEVLKRQLIKWLQVKRISVKRRNGRRPSNRSKSKRSCSRKASNLMMQWRTTSILCSFLVKAITLWRIDVEASKWRKCLQTLEIHSRKISLTIIFTSFNIFRNPLLNSLDLLSLILI